jgi:hypothetical protein
MVDVLSKRWLTPKQICADMGVHYDAFRRILRRGDGPQFKRYGARYLIRKDWYEKWIDSNEDALDRGSHR